MIWNVWIFAFYSIFLKGWKEVRIFKALFVNKSHYFHNCRHRHILIRHGMELGRMDGRMLRRYWLCIAGISRYRYFQQQKRYEQMKI